MEIESWNDCKLGRGRRESLLSFGTCANKRGAKGTTQRVDVGVNRPQRGSLCSMLHGRDSL